MLRSTIIGTGSYVPETVIKNDAFLDSQFFEKNGSKVYKSNKTIIDKFQQITGIAERRYAGEGQNASDLAFLAAKDALESSEVDKETLDYIIVAHNFGDVCSGSNRVNMVPSLASRVKALLEIKNTDCIAYDLPFGCPGWVEGLIQANYFIRSGDARRCLIIGTETLSRVIDPHDRDAMIFSDGSGAAIVEATDGETGILAHKTETHAMDASLLNMDYSNSAFGAGKHDLFLKMDGHKVYEFALENVPRVIKCLLDKANIPIDSIQKILIHQANEKMNKAILNRLFKLCGKSLVPEGIMPMTIQRLGNSSVATVPTLLDQILKGKSEGHRIQAGDAVVFASVGAGMNVNAILYQF